MKRISSIIFLVTAALLFVIGIAAADPGPNNPYRDMIVNVDCDGGDHDYEMLYTVGLSPWFDPQGATVSPGPVHVEKWVGEEWIVLFDLPGKGVPTIHCTWTRAADNYQGDVQFAPLHK